jgi:PAS domain S-box-containing protein
VGENVHLLAVSLDLDGRITFENQHLADVTGWSRGELAGRTWLEMFPTGDQDYLARVRAERIIVHDEMPLRTRSGDERSISWNNTLDRDAAGRVIGSTSIGEDVTDRNRGVRQEEALRPAGDDGRRCRPAGRDLRCRLRGGGAAPRRPDREPGALRQRARHRHGRRRLGGAVGHPDADRRRDRIRRPDRDRRGRPPGRPARVDDYARIDGDLAERLRGLGVRSSVAAPVAADGRLWGAIIVSTTSDATGG